MWPTMTDTLGESAPIRIVSSPDIMFIAHAPSGYLLSLLLLRRAREVPVPAMAVLLAGISGALAADTDLAYFYLWDECQTHHHRYVTHWPLLWLAAMAGAALWVRRNRQSRCAFLAWVFCAGGVLHVILDSLVGDIWWFAPFVDQAYSLIAVPARFEPWWLNFLLHGSFVAELAICAWAWWLYRGRARRLKRMSGASGVNPTG